MSKNHHIIFYFCHIIYQNCKGVLSEADSHPFALYNQVMVLIDKF